MPEGSIAGVTFSRAGSELTERELLEALRRKDSRGTRVFYDRYAGYLTAVALRYVPDRSAVKDILQEAFLRIFDAVDRFEYRGEGSLRSWACRIVVNGALKSLRGQGKLQYVEDLPDVPEEEDIPVQQVPAAVTEPFSTCMFLKRNPTGKSPGCWESKRTRRRPSSSAPAPCLPGK